MLEQLWSNLKPDIRRTGGRITKEWSEIGFQGTDPMTDFRYVFSSFVSLLIRIYLSRLPQWLGHSLFT
jgi:hypothetical protein